MNEQISPHSAQHIVLGNQSSKFSNDLMVSHVSRYSFVPTSVCHFPTSSSTTDPYSSLDPLPSQSQTFRVEYQPPSRTPMPCRSNHAMQSMPIPIVLPTIIIITTAVPPSHPAAPSPPASASPPPSPASPASVSYYTPLLFFA